ncbi:KTSC domain-containing protein [Pseudomonas cannabina]|nr:KTSC domain-containing protein [Pseudomonas cannabina]
MPRTGRKASGSPAVFQPHYPFDRTHWHRLARHRLVSASRASSIRGKESAMDMVHVNSSAITAVGYDPATGRMKIIFKQGPPYDYCHVPPNIYEGLIAAGSKGNYFARMIRDRYQC